MYKEIDFPSLPCSLLPSPSSFLPFPWSPSFLLKPSDPERKKSDPEHQTTQGFERKWRIEYDLRTRSCNQGTKVFERKWHQKVPIRSVKRAILSTKRPKDLNVNGAKNAILRHVLENHKKKLY